jgi:hypothetical protein
MSEDPAIGWSFERERLIERGPLPGGLVGGGVVARRRRAVRTVQRLATVSRREPFA